MIPVTSTAAFYDTAFLLQVPTRSYLVVYEYDTRGGEKASDAGRFILRAPKSLTKQRELYKNLLHYILSLGHSTSTQTTPLFLLITRPPSHLPMNISNQDWKRRYALQV